MSNSTKPKLTAQQQAHSLARMLPGYMVDVDLGSKVVVIRYLRRGTIEQEFCLGTAENYRDFHRFLKRAINLGFTQMAAYSLDRCEPELAPIRPTGHSYWCRDPLPPPDTDEELF
jgi:hypothetical protein